jgi:hypothetical protein
MILFSNRKIFCSNHIFKPETGIALSLSLQGDEVRQNDVLWSCNSSLIHHFPLTMRGEKEGYFSNCEDP